MFKKILLAIMGLLIFLFAQNTYATLVEITVDTDKDVYELGEEVVVYVDAYNPSNEEIRLNFPTALQATYILDDIFDWSDDKVFPQSPTYVVIEPLKTYTWELTHGSIEMTLYPLIVGLHSVVGKVENYGQSEPVEFQVMPEPATILLLGVGGIGLKRNWG